MRYAISLKGFAEVFVLLSPALLALGFFFETVWFLGLVGFVPLFFLLDHTKGKEQFFTAFVFGVLYAFFLGFPLLSFETINSIPVPLTTLYIAKFFIFLYLLVNGVIAGALLGIAFHLTQAWYTRLLVVPIAWFFFEIGLAYLNNGAEWGLIGETMAAFAPLRMWARIGGTNFLSWLLVFVNLCIYESAKYIFFPGKKRVSHAPLFITAASILIMIFGGVYFFQTPPTISEKKSEKVKIALVQTNFKGYWSPSYFKELQGTSRSLLENMLIENADVVIFPSLYMGPLKPQAIHRGVLQEAFGNIFEKTNMIIFGFYMLDEYGNQYSATALADQGGIIEIVPKEKLFFLGDYVPQWLRILAPTLAQYSLQNSSKPPAKTRNLFRIGNIKMGSLICNEGLIPKLARDTANKGAHILLISGSNRDFSSRFIYQETLRGGRLRAVENNSYVIQAMKTGISAVIDPTGEIIQMLDKDETGVLLYEISSSPYHGT